jgi:uncharacterized protein (TIGR00255 family)
MKSMTGFGAAEIKTEGRTLSVEITSVNSKKGLDLQLNLPRELASLENTLRSQVQKIGVRGRVNVEIHWRSDPQSGPTSLRINRAVLKNYQSEFRAVAKSLKSKDDVSLEFLLKLPGVMEDTRGPVESGKFLPVLEKMLGKALTAWDKSREREGIFLAKDLSSKFDYLEEQVGEVEKRKGPHLEAHRQALLRRLNEAGLAVALDDERVLKELALFADRSDISEEIIRLRSHFGEAERLLKSDEPAGRNLDFLLQEIGREINTIGSKGNDGEISRRVVAMKTELEKIREQVQNLE